MSQVFYFILQNYLIKICYNGFELKIYIFCLKKNNSKLIMCNFALNFNFVYYGKIFRFVYREWTAYSNR